jgi:hypothetical protein
VTLGFVSVCPNLGFFYADPGSGMLLWQLLTAAALGLLFYARTIVRRIRALIGTSDEENNAPSDGD